ncbi:hypothetical protein AGLY_007105 [Aphis glycines]|uniref:Uncharacterized protein n=1 Tax=Aphis glycines TaxID=307491 RepID=A0A6G0TNM7_APHGL|nr:hypothetical protein AGLY_007105 [Aphis glycines]
MFFRGVPDGARKGNTDVLWKRIRIICSDTERSRRRYCVQRSYTAFSQICSTSNQNYLLTSRLFPFKLYISADSDPSGDGSIARLSTEGPEIVSAVFGYSSIISFSTSVRVSNRSLLVSSGYPLTKNTDDHKREGIVLIFSFFMFWSTCFMCFKPIRDREPAAATRQRHKYLRRTRHYRITDLVQQIYLVLNDVDRLPVDVVHGGNVVVWPESKQINVRDHVLFKRGDSGQHVQRVMFLSHHDPNGADLQHRLRNRVARSRQPQSLCTVLDERPDAHEMSGHCGDDVADGIRRDRISDFFFFVISLLDDRIQLRRQQHRRTFIIVFIVQASAVRWGAEHLDFFFQHVRPLYLVHHHVLDQPPRAQVRSSSSLST